MILLNSNLKGIAASTIPLKMLLVMAFFVLSPGLFALPEAKNIKVSLGACDWTMGKSGDPSALEMAARLGLEGVQVSLNITKDSLSMSDPKLQKDYLDAAAKHSVSIASFAIGQLNDIPLKSDPRAEKFVLEGIDVAAAMKVRIILVPFFGKGDLRKDAAGMAAAIEKLRRLAPRAEKAGVILALESWLSAGEHLKIIRAVGSPAIQVYYDVGNSQEAGYDIEREIRELGDRICQFHAKDYKDLYGKGSMNFEAVRKAMEDIRYEGWLVMEGAQLPLGVEKSILYDLNYLRTVFPAASPHKKEYSLP